MIPRTIPKIFVASSLAGKTEINVERYGMHAIYMYVIQNKRIGVIVSVAGV